MTASPSPAPTTAGTAPTRPRARWLRRTVMAIGAAAAVGTLALLPARPLPPRYDRHPDPTGEPFDAYVQRQQARAQAAGVRPGNEERYVRFTPRDLTSNPTAPAAALAHAAADPPAAAPARVVILYIHGFGASRAEGEAVVDPVAQQLGADVYYTRLPGHGGDMEAHAAARVEEYFAGLEEDFHRVRALGDKLVLIGTSTGGLLSVWLATRHPDAVAAVVLASPLFELAVPGAALMSRRLGIPLIRAIMGPYRNAGWRHDPQGRKQPGYEDHWITQQRIETLATVEDVRRSALADDPAPALTAPTLLLYYYADPSHQDNVTDVSAMQRFMARTHGGRPHPLSRSVAIADGNHILMSSYVRTDKDTIRAELTRFLRAALQSPAAPAPTPHAAQ